MFYTYIIHSKSTNKLYVGSTSCMKSRLEKHCAKHKGFTSQAKDWKVVFIKVFFTKKEAMLKEKEIKNWKSRKRIEELIKIEGVE